MFSLYWSNINGEQQNILNVIKGNTYELDKLSSNGIFRPILPPIQSKCTDNPRWALVYR